MRLLVYLLWLMLVGCATSGPLFYAPEDQAYLTEALKSPNPFRLHRDQVHDAWGRAQTFIAQHSDMKLQIATDHVLDTYNPSKAGQVGYGATKTPMGDSVEISATCKPGTWMDRDRAKKNAIVFAHYIRTGMLRPDVLR